MEDRITFKEILLSIRKFWTINPKTKIINPKKKFSRPQDKQKFEQELRNGDHDE